MHQRVSPRTTQVLIRIEFAIEIIAYLSPAGRQLCLNHHRQYLQMILTLLFTTVACTAWKS